tara:strand:+ start:565 stop:762 length:198 start_codon:yes stop_codon:yes gene_type:complete
MKCHIESHGNNFYAVKKNDSGQVIATAMGLDTEEQAIKIIRERWKHKGSIKIFVEGTAKRVIDAL